MVAEIICIPGMLHRDAHDPGGRPCGDKIAEKLVDGGVVDIVVAVVDPTEDDDEPDITISKGFVACSLLCLREEWFVSGDQTASTNGHVMQRQTVMCGNGAWYVAVLTVHTGALVAP